MRSKSRVTISSRSSSVSARGSAQEIGISGQARQPVALGAVAGGGKERRRLRHGRAPRRARCFTEGDGDDDRGQLKMMRRRRRHLLCRAAFADWARRSSIMRCRRCPGCGLVVGEVGRFCLDCWNSLHFLDGPVRPAQAGSAADGAPRRRERMRRVLGRSATVRRRAGGFGLWAHRADGSATAQVWTAPWPCPADGAPDGAAFRGAGGRAEPLLVPVPLHRGRLWSRGFNQAALIADELARLTGAAHDPHLLVRRKATAALRGRGRRRRERSSQGPSRWRPMPRRARVGASSSSMMCMRARATLRAAARALRRSGAARVSALCWARVVHDVPDNAAPFDTAALGRYAAVKG